MRIKMNRRMKTISMISRFKMGNKMKTLIKYYNELAHKIENIPSSDDRKPRDYIGASIIGSDCLRQIWYEFKGFESEDVPSKMRRTWEIGRALEGTILRWIKETGIELFSDWPQLEAEGMPYFKGHVDSIWMKDGKAFAIIEAKTAKDSSFNKFVKSGLQMWNPQYYAQVQAYMGMSGIHLAYIIVLNKDNSDISDEMVNFDGAFYQDLILKAKMVARAEMPPPRVNNSPLWFQCKMCKFNKECHK